MKTGKKKQVIYLAVGTFFVAALFVFIIIMVFMKNGSATDRDNYIEDIVQENADKEESTDNKEENQQVSNGYADMEGIKTIHLQTEGYIKEIFAGWEWNMQEALTAYAKENGIEAEHAVPIFYKRYEEETQRHFFYVQMDDEAGTIVLVSYGRYRSEVMESDMTLGEILKAKSETGDKGEPEN